MQEQGVEGQYNSPALDRFHEIELEKTLDAIFGVQSLRVQVAVFFGTVNLAALGVALTTGKAIVVFFAAALLLLFAATDFGARLGIAALLRRVTRLQVRYAPNDTDFLEMFPGTEVKWAQEMATRSGPREANRFLGYTPIPNLAHQSVLGFWLPLAASLVEIGVGFTLWIGFNWPLL
ncbi:hypothetical protein ACFLYD_07595 [Chloroflexota bacterium]